MFEKVDYARLWPTSCLLCRGQKGPMADTMVEYPVAGGSADSAGRIYICRRCAKEISLVFGFAKGPELTRLIDASDIVEAKEREAKEYQEVGEQLIEQIRVKDAMIKALEKDSQHLNSKIQSLQQALDAVRRSTEDASKIASSA